LAPDANCVEKTYQKLAPDAKNAAPDAEIWHPMYLVKIYGYENILCSILKTSLGISKKLVRRQHEKTKKATTNKHGFSHKTR
jgi:hypothetical protein